MANIFFITGPCGVGKSSIINSLKKVLKKFEIHDFDDVGVPENPDLNWRHETTKYWLKVGKENLGKRKSTIICGLTIPEEIEKFMLDGLNDKVYILLLDVGAKERERRLRSRNASQELIDDLEEVIGLRKWVPKSKLKGRYIVDTTKLSIKDIGNKIEELILKVK
jgi:broad-specificity NMP kinase